MDYPILMADIRSSRVLNGTELIKQFKMLVHSINKTKKHSLRSPLTITLGDEFQAVIDSIPESINLIIDIEELIIKKNLELKLRYVLNVGSIDTRINKNIAYEMLGSGLTEARETLSMLKKEENRFLVRTKNSQLDEQLNNAFIVYQSFVDDWRKRDYLAVRAFLNDMDYKDVAKLLGVNPTTAWRKKRSLRITQYQAIKSLILSLT